MLKRLWQWLKRFIQRLLGSKQTFSPPLGKQEPRKLRKQLTDSEYESLFLQLLAEVNDGLTKGGVKGFLAANRINDANLLEWLRGFGDKLLASSESYEQALASYDKVLELKPDEHNAWNGRGSALGNLGRYEQAIASYDKALELNPDFHYAWNGRGIAAGQSVSCDRLLASLSVIARKNPALNQRGYEGELASYEEGLKYCHQDTHPEGWGVLHGAIGRTHYFQGRRVSYPRPYWYKAVHSYNDALKTLTEADFPEWHLEILQDLIRVQLDLGEIAKAEELQRRGTDLLRRLLDDCDSLGKKQQLGLKFAGFQQLTVDLAVQFESLCLASLLRGRSLLELLRGSGDNVIVQIRIRRMVDFTYQLFSF